MMTMHAMIGFSALTLLALGTPSLAQFTGPSAQGKTSTVAATRNLRLGSYVTLTGNVVTHLREEYFTFRDKTGEIRVEIPEKVWRGQNVSPTTSVRIMGEVSRGWTGRYVWVKSLDIVQ